MRRGERQLSSNGRARVGCLGAVAVLLAVAPGAVAAPAPDPTCDFPAQTTARGATVCEHTTGSQGMEPMLAVNKRGTLFMGIATDKGLYEDPGRLTGTSETYLLRSRDDGRTWRRIRLPGGIEASEGFPYIDPVTDRLFVTSLSADTTRCGQPVIHSDDEGASWTAAAERPGCSPATHGDWPKIFSGPFKGKAPGRYPNAVYVCNFIPNVLVAASIGCWRSDDGGNHFAFTGYLPTINGLCKAGDVEGGTGATIVHGSGRVLAERRRRRPAHRVRLPRGRAQQRHGEDVEGDRHGRAECRVWRTCSPGARGSCSRSPITSGPRTSPSTPTTTCTSPTSGTACT